MSSDLQKPSIAFVWRHKDIVSSVVDMARRTGAKAIFDLSSTDAESAGLALLQADAGADAVDLKISPNFLLDPGLESLLKETGINRVWFELHPLVADLDPDQLLHRVVELSEEITAVPVTGDVGLITRIITRHPAIRNIALKGNEAGGFVGAETIFTLYSAVRELIRNRTDAPDLFIWGGIALPEAAAAFLATGAKGVAFESLHWLTDLAGLDEEYKRRVSNVRPDHTDLTGLNLQVPCRLFNKGNSKAVKELKTFAGSLCGAEIRDEQRRFFAHKIVKEAIDPLESQFGRDELIPLGVEAAFAASFVRRFGSRTEEAVERFVSAIDERLSQATDKAVAFVGSPVAKAMGTVYPFIQGAMSWITDVPEFALRVAEAGGLPTIALGMMDRPTLDEKLGRISDIMGDRPYAVNVITLAENPHRDSQLEWIREKKPRFAVIAAGEPSHGAQLLESGIEVIYIAPNEELLKLAFEAGIRYVICEGNEAGGHVGQHTTMTLAQMVLDLKDQDRSFFEGRRVILAGGIFNRETALMAAIMGADAVQMGTVYLTTAEIVSSGALADLYQRMVLESEPGATVVTGEGTGLRVRSLKTPRIEAICTLERDFAAGGEDEASFRHKIEGLSAGSLFVAARGLEAPGGAALDESACVESGQFMSGACAGALRTTVSVAELHRELAQGSFAAGLPFLGPLRDVPVPRPSGVEFSDEAMVRLGRGAPRRAPQPEYERIAVTGMSVFNSLGNSPEEVWDASFRMTSGIVLVPPSRWNHEDFFHPRPRMSEKTYCKVGAFSSIDVSRKELGIPPQDFRTMTDATKITLWLAKQAIEDSGILDSDIPRERIGVLISQNSGEAAATLRDVIIRGSANQFVSAVKKIVDLAPETERAIEEEVKSGRIAIDDTTLLGRLNCSAGGFICNKYAFMGPSFAVSAACATALVALFSAVQMIRNGILDAAVVGGAEEFLTPMHFLEFSALGALAGLSGVDRPPTETSRPFDADRDGMVLGEGGGVIIVERESVARRRGARAHAYITSMGASNNHLGMVESAAVTQEIAIRASFQNIPYGPDAVDLVECHATSTKQGDVEEVHALNSFFNSGKRPTVLTSFKSQIGHTLGASGVNSLIRGVMAMKAGIFPPTLNYQRPDSEMGLEDSGFLVPTEPTRWEGQNGSPRRLQVNAFGFGGSNYVVQLEEALEEQDTVLVSTVENATPHTERGESTLLPDGMFFFKTEIGGTPYRVAVLGDTEKKALASIEGNEPFSNDAPVAVKRLKALARQGIHLGVENVPAPPLAFVFPGQGSHYAGMGRELYETFPVVHEWMDRAASVADFDILSLLFQDREEDLQKTRWQQPALFTLEYAMVQYLVSLGIRPTALAGHSLGELTALCLAGVYSFEDGFRIVNKRAICMDKACEMNVDPGIMVACDAPMDVLKEMMGQREGVYLTNINSPHQIVIGGDTETAHAMGAELKTRGFRSTALRVSMAFHSPIMRCIHDELEEFIAGIEFHSPEIPVISNTTMQPFSVDTAEIKRTVMAHLESPVHWMQNVGTLWNDYGVRVFVEVGPREILSNLIADTIEEADCIQTCLPSAEAIIYKTALAQLYARGNLTVRSTPRFVSFPGTAKPAGPSPSAVVPRPVATAMAGPSALEQIIQREINSFVLDSFGRFLRPAILAAVRSHHDPRFKEENLDQLLAGLFPSAGPALHFPSGHVAGPAGEVPLTTLPVTAAPAVQEQAPVGPGTDDVTETVISIIMEATGYERSEIEPDMDLREDLSIRSSRLPVIMDAVEGHFAIKIELEDFMDVRTVRDIAERITTVVARTQETTAAPKKSEVPEATRVGSPVPADTREQKSDIKRILFTEAPLEAGTLQPVELDLMESVAILSSTAGTGLRKEVGTVFRRDYGVNIVPLTFMESGADPENGGFDLLTESGAAQAVQRITQISSLAGMVITVDDLLEERLRSMEDVSLVLKGFFSLLKTFAESPVRKFALLIQKSEQPDGFGRLVAEGMLGIFLSAALEYGSVQFRAVQLHKGIDLRDAVRGALDRGSKPVQTIYREDGTFTIQGREVPSSFPDSPGLELGPDDVVVLSGGGYGITPFLARSLVPFGCKIVFLGRTELDPNMDFRKLLSRQGKSEEVANEVIDETSPGLPAAEREQEVGRIGRALEIVRNVERLRTLGVDASYYSCDVTDPGRVKTVLDRIVKRYKKIDGIVHGAGILRDRLIKEMTPEDFSSVVDVKFLGAWNLFHAARSFGLRFQVCLSSAASIQGNPGQCNYAAGNRMMAALMTHLRSQESSIRFKALMLPPIEGAGMAENPEIRALMKRMNATYVRVEELAELFCREIFIATPDDTWVLFMRSLPDLPTVRLDASELPVPPGEVRAAAVSFRKEDFPMIDSVSRIDIAKGELEATRTFSQARDLWVLDHKPFKFLKHPLVSAIMALETFMEAARILYPHLNVRSVRNAEFLDIIECPPGISRTSEISCRRVGGGGRDVACEVSLSTGEISPAGRVLERLSFNYKALIILSGATDGRGSDSHGFPVRPEELDSRPMDRSEVLRWYEDRSDMQGRYRIMDHLEGSGPGVIRGQFTYRQREDFAGRSKPNYQYSPYLLEGLLQAVNFYIVMRDPSESRSMIPQRIEEMAFYRKCSDGEKIVVEARVSAQTPEGITWDARGLDDQNRVIMRVRGMAMQWFSR